MKKKRVVYNVVRRTWGRKPQTQVSPDRKKYDRRRDKERMRRETEPAVGRGEKEQPVFIWYKEDSLQAI